jgi:glucans biosynthesis protein
VRWTLAGAPPSNLAQVVQTRRGHGYRKDVPPRQQLLHVDFAGRRLDDLGPDAAVEALVSGNDNAVALKAIAYPNPERGGWRVSLQFERLEAARPVELRLQLHLAGEVLSETWAYALSPE